MSGITAEQHSILRHALGLGREQKSHRNYYAAGPDDGDCDTLVKKGMMKKWGTADPDIYPNLTFYRVTNFGKKIANGKLIGEE